MPIIFLALANMLFGAIYTIKLKKMRSRGLSPISAFGLLCSGLPLWLISFILLDRRYDIVYSDEYFFYTLLWTAISILTNLGIVFLMKFSALSEQTIYRLGFSAMFGFIIDLYFFKTDFSLFMLAGMVLLFISGILLSRNRKIDGMSIPSILSATALISILMALQLSAYKYALAIQPDPLIHNALSHLIAYISLLLLAFRQLRKDYISHAFGRKDIIDFSLLIFLFTVTEALLFERLPVTIMILLSVMNLLIFAAYDIRRKELEMSRQIYLAGALSIMALIMINS